MGAGTRRSRGERRFDFTYPLCIRIALDSTMYSSTWCVMLKRFCSIVHWSHVSGITRHSIIFFGIPRQGEMPHVFFLSGGIHLSSVQQPFGFHKCTSHAGRHESRRLRSPPPGLQRTLARSSPLPHLLLFSARTPNRPYLEIEP